MAKVVTNTVITGGSPKNTIVMIRATGGDRKSALYCTVIAAIPNAMKASVYSGVAQEWYLDLPTVETKSKAGNAIPAKKYGVVLQIMQRRQSCYNQPETIFLRMIRHAYLYT